MPKPKSNYQAPRTTRFDLLGQCVCGQPVYMNESHVLAHPAPECEFYQKYEDTLSYLKALNIATGAYKTPKTGEA